MSAPREDVHPPVERFITVSPLVQVSFALAFVFFLLGLAAALGFAAAQRAGVSVPSNPRWRGAMPLTSAALMAELVAPADLAPNLEPDSGIAGQARAAVAISGSAGPSQPAIQQPAIASVTEAEVSNLDAGGCVNVRETPSLGGQVLRCLPAHQILQLTSVPREADGYRWWQLEAGGWAAETYLTIRGPVSAIPTAAAIAPSTSPLISAAASGPAGASRILTGWATYYGVEDGFRLGDIMYDGTPFNPGDPTMTAASFSIPLHSWLLVCAAVRCIVVQVRDRGLLDENGILLDLSRAAFAQLFGLAGLSGKQRVTTLILDPAITALFPLYTPTQGLR